MSKDLHPDWEYELNRLEKTKKQIKDQLTERINSSEDYKKEMQKINKEMWEEVGGLSGATTMEAIPAFLQGVGFLKQNMSNVSENNKKIKMLIRQLESPYFARIDFQEDGYDRESFYIGIYGFHDIDDEESWIYDWRAPISSMFYDYELGRASYESPSGTIKGEVFLKRQYRIEKGELLLVFDSSIAIQDNILQDILGENTNNKMKTIVSTIQREQNQVIRYEGKRVLAVQGPAGSGKTSIALHRAAYFLYRYRNTIKPNQICLFTPNETFATYISTVLPELGEEELPSITLTVLAKKELGERLKTYESYSEMMEYQLIQKTIDKLDPRLESIKIKTSKQFASILEKFIQFVEKKLITFHDIKIKDTVFAAGGELEELFYHSFCHMPLAKRLSRMKTVVMPRVKEYEDHRRQEIIRELASSPDYINEDEIKEKGLLMVTKELEEVKVELEKMLSMDIVDIYGRLFDQFMNSTSWNEVCLEEVIKSTVEDLKKGILYYEDQAPILYLMLLVGMINPDHEKRYVIIDEAQDYCEVAFRFFSELYPRCQITLLGDLNQNIDPIGGIESLKYAAELISIDSAEYIELTKSYRSTVEIMEFASQILPSGVIPYGRNGEKPKVITGNAVEKICNLMSKRIKDLKKEGFKTIAIICRTLKDCYTINEYLKSQISLHLIAQGDDEIDSDIIIIPSYLSKGLEFDVVIPVILSEKDYREDEKQLFYTVCTRALHRLEIYTLKSCDILKK